MSRFDTLSDWLSYLEQSHPKSIDLGLERVFKVANNLSILGATSDVSHDFSACLRSNDNLNTTVVTIAGTNGKGSCVSTIEQFLLFEPRPQSATTTRPLVGSYTSPHFHHYCERIKIDGEPVSESMVCEAFSAIDAARGNISLTYFEFGTLAALWIFVQQQVEVVLLEVGLGGRLDAVNIIDADIAVITSIDLDHQDWLGDDREVISREKLGIAREGKSLIIAESDSTPSILAAANSESSLMVGRDFYFSKSHQNQWQFKTKTIDMTLPIPSLPLASVASAMVVLERLGKLTSNIELVKQLMASLQLKGRFEKTHFNGVEIIFDVAHNPAASFALAQALTGFTEHPDERTRTFGVFAIMQDKDSVTVIESIINAIDVWYLGDINDNERAAKAKDIADSIASLPLKPSEPVVIKDSIESAFDAALSQASTHDRIVVFGSFFTVAAIQAHIDKVLANSAFADTRDSV